MTNITSEQGEASVAKKRIFTDNLISGFIMGGLTPVIALVVYYYAKVAPNGWGVFFKYLYAEKRLLSSLTVICLVPNIGLFTLFINTHKDKIAKGIFAATLLFAVASLLIKFLG